MDTITRDELKKRLDQGEEITLVDALSEDQYQESHLPGAISIPAREVADKAPAVLKDKNAQIVTYCGNESCPASRDAAQALRDLGYKNVSEYAGGKEDWLEAGLPIEGGASKTDGVNLAQNAG